MQVPKTVQLEGGALGSAREVGEGGTCQVFAVEPIAGAKSERDLLILKRLFPSDVAVQLWQHECEMLKRFGQHTSVRALIPTIVSSQEATLEILMQPVGLVMRRRDLSQKLITSLLDYAIGLAEDGYADWDLRDANVMMVSMLHAASGTRVRCA